MRVGGASATHTNAAEFNDVTLRRRAATATAAVPPVSGGTPKRCMTLELVPSMGGAAKP